MTDLRLFMLICIHNDLRDLVSLVAIFLLVHSIDRIFDGSGKKQ